MSPSPMSRKNESVHDVLILSPLATLKDKRCKMNKTDAKKRIEELRRKTEYYAQTFYSIIGFTIGSILVLLPQGMTWLETILCVLCVILGVYVSRIPDAIKNFRSSKMFKAVKVLNKMRSQSKTQKD